MNASHNGLIPDPAPRQGYGPGEDTLRLIASLPAPSGLASRVQAVLRTAPQRGRILTGPSPLRPPFGWMYAGWMRGLAAAGIVCVVAGGGWHLYTRVQPSGAARIVVIPATGAPGGSNFSTSGVKRIPQPVDGPVLIHPPAPSSEVNVVQKVPSPSRPAVSAKKKKPLARAAAPVE